MIEQTNIEKFEQYLNSIEREGIDKLIEFIKKSDFYTAPASTRYHSCHQGGLLEHSLNVLECLLKKFDNPVWSEILNEVGRESAILCALLHDICKSYYYGIEEKNKKIYSEYGKKVDKKGRFDWETVDTFVVDDKG